MSDTAIISDEGRAPVVVQQRQRGFYIQSGRATLNLSVAEAQRLSDFINQPQSRNWPRRMSNCTYGCFTITPELRDALAQPEGKAEKRPQGLDFSQPRRGSDD